MSRGTGSFTSEENEIVEIYGQAVHSDHDWHDTEYLETLILAKYDRVTAQKALESLLEWTGRPVEPDVEYSLGEMMRRFIQARADRFTWQPGELELVSMICPRCHKTIDCREEVPKVCPQCYKDIGEG